MCEHGTAAGGADCPLCEEDRRGQLDAILALDDWRGWRLVGYGCGAYVLACLAVAAFFVYSIPSALLGLFGQFLGGGR